MTKRRFKSSTDWNTLLQQHRGPDFAQLILDCIKRERDGESVQNILNSLPVIQTTTMRDTRGTYAVFGRDLIDSATFDQMNIVSRLPVYITGALMPDAHVGYAMPIGGVALLDMAVAPYFVGVDIGCRVSAIPFTLTRGSTFENARSTLEKAAIAISAFGLRTLDEYHDIMRHDSWMEYDILRRNKDRAQAQLGTSGGGNHFIDLARSSQTDSNGNAVYYLLMHSGSRGTGAKAGKYYDELASDWCAENHINVPKHYGYFPAISDEGREYLAVHNALVKWSLANHEVIATRFFKTVGGLVNTDITIPGMTISWLHRRVRGIPLSLWSTPHNFVEWYQDFNASGYLHRKGASPALPLSHTIIPGSSAGYTYIVEGKGNVLSLYSTSHGAGRSKSRSAMKKQQDTKELERIKKHVEDFGVHLYGVAIDEQWAAYKDPDTVILAQSNLLEVHDRLIPFCVIMGGESDDGD